MLRTKNHGRRTPHGRRRTDIWITKSLPELSSGETKSIPHFIFRILIFFSFENFQVLNDFFKIFHFHFFASKTGLKLS